MWYPTCQVRWTWPTPKVVAKGRMAYRDSTISPANDMRCIQLALFDKNHDGSERFLGVKSKTDLHGYFTFPCIDNVDSTEGGGPLDLFVRAYFMSDSTGFAQPQPPTIKPITMYRQDGSIWCADTEVRWDCAGIDPNHSIVDFGTQKPATTDYPTNTAMHIYTTLLRGWDWVAARTNPLDPSQVMDSTRVYWDWEWPQITGTEGHVIRVNGHGDRDWFAPDEWDDWVTLHEYGHRVEERYRFHGNNLNPNHSGLMEDLDTSGHPSPGLAWDEGWATFFAGVTQTVGGSAFMFNVGWNPNTPVSDRNRLRLYLEDGWYWQEYPVNHVIDATKMRFNSQGATWEWPVACTLWDIYDTPADNQSDNPCADSYVEDGAHTYTFNACRIVGNTNPFDIFRFYDEFKGQHPDGITINHLRDTFCEHGIDVSNRSGELLAKNAGIRGTSDPARFALLQNAPNPFRGRTEISFALARTQAVRLGIFDLRGRLLCQVLDGSTLPAGAHVITWDGRDARGGRVAPGVYLYQIESDGFVDRKKLIVLP